MTAKMSDLDKPAASKTCENPNHQVWMKLAEKVTAMTREELLRILSFLDSNRQIPEKDSGLFTVDPRWNIISFALRRHLEGKLITVTSAAMAADVPYGTAMRRISELIDEGRLHKRPKSRSGKSFSLHPTRQLIDEFERFATQLKKSLADTFGFRGTDGKIDDFFFGGYYMASRILPYPNAMRVGIGYRRRFRILASEDPTFQTIHRLSSTLEELCGGQVEITNLPLDKLLPQIIRNASQKESGYDLVAVDLPWIGQLAEDGVIEPLDELIAEAGFNSSDFHSAALRGSAWRGIQYGLPIQPTVELLFCRTDLFKDAGLDLPETTADLMDAARALHRSSFAQAGIVMNFGRGIPVAHSFIQSLADFGQPVINLRSVGEDYDISNLEPDNFRPMLNTETAHQTAEFLLDLLAYAHRDSLTCTWDKRIAIFAKGQAAMTYGWSVRASTIELDKNASARGKVSYVQHPHGPNARHVSPIGGFSLAMPAGLDGQRRAVSWKMMEYLTRPELLKWYVQNGNPSSPRFSTSADPEVRAASPLIGVIDGLEKRGAVQSWPRPAIPEFSQLLHILGEEVHALLRRDKTIPAALDSAQNRVDQIMVANGRYR